MFTLLNFSLLFLWLNWSKSRLKGLDTNQRKKESHNWINLLLLSCISFILFNGAEGNYFIDKPMINLLYHAIPFLQRLPWFLLIGACQLCLQKTVFCPQLLTFMFELFLHNLPSWLKIPFLGIKISCARYL